MISKLIDMPKVVTVTPETKPRYTPPTPVSAPMSEKLPQEVVLTAPDPEFSHEHGPFWMATHA